MDYALDFEFNGLHSSTFGVSKITMESGMLTEDYYLPNKTINGFTIKSEERTHLTSIDKEPLVIPMTIWLNGNVDFEREQRIKRWLETDNFCKLVLGDNPYHYNAMLEGSVSLKHNANDDGYIEVTFRTDSPYRWSDDVIVKGKCENLTEPLKRKFLNVGAKTIYPIIKITAPGVTKVIEIRNKTTGEYFHLKGEYTNLTLEILNKQEELNTEGNFTNLYENHNGQFISFIEGKNDIEMKGSFYYEFVYKNLYL